MQRVRVRGGGGGEAVTREAQGDQKQEGYIETGVRYTCLTFISLRRPVTRTPPPLCTV